MQNCYHQKRYFLAHNAPQTVDYGGRALPGSGRKEREVVDRKLESDFYSRFGRIDLKTLCSRSLYCLIGLL